MSWVEIKENLKYICLVKFLRSDIDILIRNDMMRTVVLIKTTENKVLLCQNINSIWYPQMMNYFPFIDIVFSNT